MSLTQCYAHMGGNLSDVRGRMPSDSFIQRFALAFLDDPSFDAMVRAWERGDVAEAFRGAHTLKGICGDLGFTGLYETSCALTDALRPGEDGLPRDVEAVPALLPGVCDAYALTVEAISLIDR